MSIVVTGATGHLGRLVVEALLDRGADRGHPGLALAGGVDGLFASALVPRVLDWRNDLARLNPLTRHIIWTHGAFVMLTIIAFGVVSLAIPGVLASGDPLARAVCGFIAAFWGTRLVVQFFVFDARPHLTSWFLTVGYHTLTVVFAYLTVVYAVAAVRG